MDNPFIIALMIYIIAVLPAIASVMFIDWRSEYRITEWKDWAGILAIFLIFLLIGATIQKYLGA